jgi:anti-sigma28 factor (negative regulator of flagellin synthesis)
MATTRKPGTKKTAAKKAPAKKAGAKKASPKKAAVAKAATIALSGTIPKLQLNMPLDAKKIAAIQRCIAKGTLSVSLSKVDLTGGKLGGPWLYD